MFSKDFAYYTSEVPCLYFGIGLARDNLGYANVHTGDFSVHPEVFRYAVELFWSIAVVSRKSGQK